MLRKEKPTPGHYYHIYNRGVNYQNIFFGEDNWAFFLRRLRHYFAPDKAVIIAYCLMPNHYHLLAFLKTEDFGSKVMQPFMVSYTKAINKQQARVGPLFQGPYRAKRVDNNRYLLHLSRYIHLNPVMAGFAVKPEHWDYSSYQDYIGMRQGSLPHPQVVLEQMEEEVSETGDLVFGKKRVSRQEAYADFIREAEKPGFSDTSLMNSLLFKED